jgi:hypothetical protein
MLYFQNGIPISTQNNETKVSSFCGDYEAVPLLPNELDRVIGLEKSVQGNAFFTFVKLFGLQFTFDESRYLRELKQRTILTIMLFLT